MSKPKLLMLDEPSLGLAPIVVREIFDIIRTVNQQGITVLLNEQNATWPEGGRLRLCAGDRYPDPFRHGC